MASIIDYERVTQRMQAEGLRCLYHNSGAFGFAPGVAVHATGWIGPDDPTIRPAARALAKSVPPPYPESLAALMTRAWTGLLPDGPAWLSPKSHWHYELEFGSREWMPDALARAGIDAGLLATRNNGAAIEFLPAECERLAALVRDLLANLVGSDFQLTWPGRAALCTVHHHKQLWWTSTDAALPAKLDALLGGR